MRNIYLFYSVWERKLYNSSSTTLNLLQKVNLKHDLLLDYKELNECFGLILETSYQTYFHLDLDVYLSIFMLNNHLNIYQQWIWNQD